MTEGVAFSGAVLTGGASRRMGRDKAFVEVGGQAMVVIAADALRAAGASEVFTVGGDRPRLLALGLANETDRHPAQGPLGGLVTALEAATEPIVVVLTCDLPRIRAEVVTALVDALATRPDAMVAAPRIGDRPQFLSAAYRRDPARGPLAAAFAAGERAVRRAVAQLVDVPVTGLDPRALQDADTVADLPGTGRSSDVERGAAPAEGPAGQPG